MENKLNKQIEYIIKLIKEFKETYKLSDNQIIDLAIIEAHLKTLL
jgi:hypothetical protein